MANAVDGRQYELIYIVAPVATDAEVAELQAEVDGHIGSLGGTVENTDLWGRRKLAYQIGNYGEGIYICQLISGPGTMIGELERRLEGEQRLRGRLAHLLSSVEAAGSAITNDLLTVLEAMAMLDTNVQRRISILVYADLEGAHEHLTRVFGLGPGELSRDEEGNVVHGEIQAGDGVVWLHRETREFGLASPMALGAATGCTAVMVDDVDAHFRHAREQGAEIAYEPVDQPYGYREYSARDLEGHLWSFMKPID